MRKFTLLALSALFSTSLFAGTPIREMKNGFTTTNRVSLSISPKKALATNPTIIDKQPEGTAAIYGRKGFASSSDNDYSQEFSTITIVTAADGKTVYLKDPVAGFMANSWVKGTIDKGIITVPTGQPLYYSSKYNAYVFLALGKVGKATQNGEEYDVIVEDESVKEVKYAVMGNTINLLGTSAKAPLAAIWSDEGYAQGYDYNSEYSPYTGKDLELPATAKETKKYPLHLTDAKGNKIDTTITVAKDGDKLYFQGIDHNSPKAWALATLKGDTLYFDGNVQSVLNEDGYQIFYEGIEAGPATEESPTGTVVLNTLKMVYNKTDDNYKLAPSQIFSLNVGNKEVNPYSYYTKFTIGKVTEVALVPDTVSFVTFIDTDEEKQEAGMLAFYLPTKSVDGQELDESNLYYKLFVKSGNAYGPLKLAASIYGEEASKDSISASFSNDYIFQLYGINAISLVYKTSLWDAFGVQTIYTAANEVKYSPIKWYDIAAKRVAADINEVSAKTVKSEKYYNAAGAEVSPSTPGLLIKKTTYSDGTTKSVKIAK